MLDVFQQDVDAAQVTEGDCEPQEWAHVGTWSDPAHGQPGGRVLCFTRPGEVRIVWTHDDANVFVHAVRDGDGSVDLHEWWLMASTAVGRL